ncbi:synaptonemal complex central element protein 1-like [Octodon degus]|uniref:Synaptonemal complex central element protein 1-like n=1 Tax=Octodon degus TaxID=10160 RepID=A0A6P3ELQ5_OCTDE|nr:synaptonemal complex central element protein 1-like [Octodon degus]
MAETRDRLSQESTGAVEEGEGQAGFLEEPEDLLAMVKKLQKEGTLEPQIEDLIRRINELQQAKKKSDEELRETKALWEALNRELDSLNGEKMHLEEILKKKQEALVILQQHRQVQEGETPRLIVEEQQKDLVAQRKDLWEFRVLEQRLARDIRALERNREHLRANGSRLRARLQEMEHRLRPTPELGAAPAGSGRLLAELRSLEEPGERWGLGLETRGQDRAGEDAAGSREQGDPASRRRPAATLSPLQACDAEDEPEPQAEPAP